MKTIFRIAASLAILPLASCGKGDEQVAALPRPVLTMTVASLLESGPGFAGTVEARYQTDRGFQVLGRIESIDVDVGDLIAKGQRLAELDPTSFQLDVNSKIGDVARAEARLKNASSRLDRTRRLVSRGSSTEAQLEADVQTRAAAQAALDQANAELAKARTHVAYTVLTADQEGVVISKDADIGRTVNAGQPVMTIARTDIREVVVDVPEDVANALHTGEAFEISLQADPDVKAQGLVREISPQADAATRTRRIRITLETPPEPFRLGATVTAKLREPSSGAVALKIPSSAVVENGGKTRVWLVDPQAKTVRSVDTTIERSGGSQVQVSNGLSVGDIVVVAGVSDLSEGQKVVFDGVRGQ